MSDLADFLLARIAEDEAVARAATTLGYGWDADGLAGDVYASGDDPQTGTVVAEAGEHADAEHIARWDPARVLAECEAKRRIVEAYLDERTRRDIYWDADESDLNDDDRSRRQSTTARTRGLEIAVEALAMPYADHDGYREEWRP